MKNSVYRGRARVVAQNWPCYTHRCGFTGDEWEGSLFGDDGKVHPTWFVLLLVPFQVLRPIKG
jgi:hypothetical protein